MIIIVEGIDRVGKTTLVNKLNLMVDNSKILKLDRLMGNSNISEKAKDLNLGRAYGLVEAMNLNTKDNIIIDRFHLTEAVYNTLRENSESDCLSIKSLEYFTSVENMMVKNNYILVLVQPTDIEKSSKEHGSDLSTHKEFFDYLFNNTDIGNKYICDYNNIDRMCDLIVEKIVFDNKIKARELDINLRMRRKTK